MDKKKSSLVLTQRMNVAGTLQIFLCGNNTNSISKVFWSLVSLIQTKTNKTKKKKEKILLSQPDLTQSEFISQTLSVCPVLSQSQSVPLIPLRGTTPEATLRNSPVLTTTPSSPA